MRLKSFLVGLLVSGLAIILYADIIQKPHTFEPGQVIKSAEVNANFDTIYNEFNGNITGSNIKNASIPKIKLMGYPFVGYVDISEATIYDTQISLNANISYTKLLGVADLFTNQAIGGIKTLNNVWTYSDSIASDTSLFQDDGQIPSKRYVDWMVSKAGGGTGNWLGSYPIITADISDSAVTNSKLSSNSVSTSKIQDGAITTPKLGDYSVNETKLADNSVSTNKIQDGAITADKLASNSIDSSKIVNGAITNEDISATANISLSKLASYPFTTSDIQDSAITTAKIQDNSISTAKLQDNSITETKIQDGAITTTKLQDSSITETKIQDGVITRSKIADLNGILHYTTADTIQNDTDIVHKKYVDDKVNSSGGSYIVKDYVKTATMTNNLQYANAENCRDRDTNTHATLANSGEYIKFDFGSSKFISHILVKISEGSITLMGSNNNTTWTSITSIDTGVFPPKLTDVIVINLFRYLKIIQTSGSSGDLHLDEISIFGTDQ